MSECPFEGRALRAVRLGLVDGEMGAHAGTCAGCSELLEIAGLLSDDRRSAMEKARVPSSGALWFSMQLRARRESARRSRRMATLVQLVSLLAGLAIAFATLGVPDPSGMFAWTITPSMLLLAGSGVALVALFAPVAVYLAIARR